MRRPPSVTFVVMAGGKGERLWPLVRAAAPKVCLSPTGRRSLLQATIDRLRPAWPRASWLIVTTQGQAEAVRASVPPSLRRTVMVEPQIKNTAACITLAAVAQAIRDPQRVLVVAPADHWVNQVGVFQRAIRTAIRASVERDTIVTIGIRPTHAHPGLGYLCAGSLLKGCGAPRVFRLARFIEKPSRVQARRLLKRPRTYWNSGIFVGTADKFLECVTEWLPDHTRRLVPLAITASRSRDRQVALGSPAFTRRASEAYRALEAVSFDHGVMDHVRGGLVVEGRFSWADLGSWDTWAHLCRSTSRTVALDSQNITVVGQDGHLIVAIGVRDLLVVHTASATLICRPDKAQEVREVVRRLSKDPRLAAYRRISLREIQYLVKRKTHAGTRIGCRRPPDRGGAERRVGAHRPAADGAGAARGVR